MQDPLAGIQSTTSALAFEALRTTHARGQGPAPLEIGERRTPSRQIVPHRRRNLLRTAWLALGAVAATLAGGVVPAGAATGPPVIVYGDSLLHEAGSYTRDMLRVLGQLDSKVLGAPGGATCDLFDEMGRDIRRGGARAVVLVFSGNAHTPCMKDRQGKALTRDAWLAKYRADTIRAIEMWRAAGALVYLATAPISLFAEREGQDDVWRLAAMYRDLSRRYRGVHVADAAQAVLWRGRWTRTLKCLPREPCQGGVDQNGWRVNVVRAPDGAHFCPVPYPRLENCPSYASGGLRYGVGIVLPVLGGLGRFDQGRFDRSIAAGWPGT